MRRSKVVVAVALAVVAAPAPAAACVPLQSTDYGPPSPSDDVTPPTAIAYPVVVIHDAAAGCSDGGDCAGLRVYRVRFVVSDDRTPFDQLGYEVAVVGGHADGVTIPDGPQHYGERPGEVFLNATDFEDVDFDLAITPLDRSHNRGPTTVVHIHAAGNGEGCSMVPRRGASTSALLVVLASLLTLRRRRPRPASALTGRL